MTHDSLQCRRDPAAVAAKGTSALAGGAGGGGGLLAVEVLLLRRSVGCGCRGGRLDHRHGLL